MGTVWRIVRTLLGLAGLAGTLLCLAGIGGCWILHAETVSRTNRAFGRITDSLDAERANLTRAHDQLVGTREELSALRERSAAANTAERATRRLKLHQTSDAAATKLADARRVVAGATEAALLAEGFVSALAELQVVDRFGIEDGSLREAGERLSDAARGAERLSGLLGPTAPDPAGTVVQEQSSRVDELLNRVVGAVRTGADRLESGRERAEAARARLVRIVTGTAAGCTVLLLWIGAGQVSLLVRCLCRR